MVNAAAQLSLTTALPSAPAAPGAPRGFSFDAAVASVRRKAARALDIHGGAPADAVTQARSAPPDAAAAARAAAPAPSQDPKADASRAAPAAPAPATARAPAGALPAAPLAAVAAATGANGPSIAAPPPAAPSSIAAPAALREASARLKAEAPRAPIPLRAPSQAVTQFAEILAQRLENASQFDFRLDPPALGSVEGRLTLADDGQARLALSFDNSSAFDLFSRDEGALRLALGDAGFDLAGRDLQFSFREPAGAPGRPAPAPEASFPTLAPLHRGAVDIRA